MPVHAHTYTHKHHMDTPVNISFSLPFFVHQCSHHALPLPLRVIDLQLAIGAKSKGDRPQVLFLRTISLSPETVAPAGSERAILTALDEIERALQVLHQSNTS